MEKTPQGLTLEVEIPVNTSATIHVPCSSASRVTEGRFPASESPSIRLLRKETGYAVFAAGSGSYEFLARWRINISAGE